jgi:hypothetical protein
MLDRWAIKSVASPPAWLQPRIRPPWPSRMLSQLTVVSWTASCPGKLTPYKPLQAFFAAFGASFDVSKQTCPGQSWVNALRVGEGGGGGGGLIPGGATSNTLVGCSWVAVGISSKNPCLLHGWTCGGAVWNCQESSLILRFHTSVLLRSDTTADLAYGRARGRLPLL